MWSHGFVSDSPSQGINKIEVVEASDKAKTDKVVLRSSEVLVQVQACCINYPE